MDTTDLNLQSISDALYEVNLTQSAQREIHKMNGRDDLRVAAKAAHDAEMTAAGKAEGVHGKIKLLRRKRMNDPEFRSDGF